MLSSNVPVLHDPTQRGVHFITAPAGVVVIQAIDSEGHEAVHFRIAEELFDQEYIEMLWGLLDKRDAIRRRSRMQLG